MELPTRSKRCYGPPVTETPAKSHALAALGAACALVPALAMWGFTVDDALISVRYAHNLVTGAGYRFDARGPSTDGVTPLPWAFILSPLAAADPLTTLVRAKVLGILVWTLAGGALGARVAAMVGRAGGQRIQLALGASALLVMGLAFPIGAWAGSGMETGLATALATLAVTRFGRPRQLALLAGLASSLRPEMVVWALAVSVGSAVVERTRRDGEGEASARSASAASQAKDYVAAAAIAVAPFVICAAIRAVVFGRVAPLAVLAKPSDLAHGLIYAGAAVLVLLTPVLALAPLGLVKAPKIGMARVLVLAFVAHAAAVIGAGGDWMPYARLMVPVAPSLVLAFVDVASKTRPMWSLLRVAVAAVFGAVVARSAAPAGRNVHADRADLVARARPVLAGAKVVAALDVGWTSAATDARIMDLAGLTDPAIALLAGGHTSKRVDTTMLLDRGVDTVIVYSELRAVETRILWSELFGSRFEAVERLPVGSRGEFYTVYRLRKEPLQSEPGL